MLVGVAVLMGRPGLAMRTMALMYGSRSESTIQIILPASEKDTSTYPQVHLRSTPCSFAREARIYRRVCFRPC